MTETGSHSTAGRLFRLLLLFVAVLAFFYGLDHLVMGLQGLPLNLDLTPAG